MLSSDVTFKDNKLFNEMTSKFREIKACNYKGSMYNSEPTHDEITMFNVVLEFAKENKKDQLSKIRSLGNYFVEIRTSSFVFCEKKSGLKLTVSNP